MSEELRTIKYIDLSGNVTQITQEQALSEIISFLRRSGEAGFKCNSTEETGFWLVSASGNESGPSVSFEGPETQIFAVKLFAMMLVKDPPATEKFLCMCAGHLIDRENIKYITRLARGDIPFENVY